MISVCVATYNASRYIREQINSVLIQLNADDEIVVSDDESSDDTLAILDSINDHRIKILSRNGNLGVIKNFERALYVAKGEVIFLCDQDDVWLPNKVSTCLNYLDSNLLVVTDCIVVDAELKCLHKSFFALRNSRKGFIHNLYRNSYIGCCMAFKRELLSYALPIPSKVAMHDIWLGMVAEKYGRVTFLPTPLLLYRRHSENASPLKSRYGMFKKIHFRVMLIFFIFTRVTNIYFKRE